MPRRKRTKMPQTSRKRPVLPEGDLDTSMTAEERRQKLEVYLQDFDLQAKGKISRIKTCVNSMICKIRGAVKLEVIKLPSHIRKMKMLDFIAHGGRVNDTALVEVSKVLSEMANSVFQNAPVPSDRAPLIKVANTELKTPAQTTRKKRGKNVDEQLSETAATTGRTLRTRKRKGVPMSPSASERQTRNKAARTEDPQSVMPPPATTGMKTTRRNLSKIQNHFITPAGKALPCGAYTPFVTPKFDPRLPITSALLREARAGERIMSLSGSPVTNRGVVEDTAQVFIPIGDGKTFQFSSQCSVSPGHTPVLNDVARKNVELLQMQLSRLLRVPPKLMTKK